MATRIHIKHRLLLDEGLPKKEAYFQANNYHNLRHIVHDFGKSGAKDKEVYSIANKEKRIVVVFNTKDFKPLTTFKSMSVISLSTNLNDRQVDLKLCKILRLLKPSEIVGYLITITNNLIKVTKQ